MSEKKNKQLKVSQMLILAGFLVILGLFISQEALAAACANVPLGGSYTVAASCAFDGTVNGVENGTTTISSGMTLTINSGQTVVWNPGYSIIINGSIAINKGTPGGQLRKTYIWMIDADNDGYSATSTQYAQDTSPANGKRRWQMTSAALDYSDTDSAIYPGRCCNGGCSINNSDGTCGSRVAGEVGCTALTGATTTLPACQRCNGVSTATTTVADNTQDTEGTNTCTATCRKCSAGSCALQTSAEDLFNHCTTATPPAADSCKSANCSGTGAACGYLSAGEQSQPVCKRCSGSSYDPVNIDSTAQDSEGTNKCDNTSGTCYRCSGAGSCTYQLATQDLGSQCAQGTTASDGCSSNNCSGTGYACGVQSSGDGGCPVCGTCTDADIACEYHTSGIADSGCGSNCCSGSEIGSCTSVCCGSTYSGDNSNFNFQATRWMFQTFTPCTSHQLQFVKLKLFRYGSPGTLTVGIRATDGSGLPTGADIKSGTFDGNTITTDTAGAWYTIPFPSVVNVTSGVKYAIVMRAINGDSSNHLQTRLSTNANATYCCGWGDYSEDSGNTWMGVSTWDLPFEETP